MQELLGSYRGVSLGTSELVSTKGLIGFTRAFVWGCVWILWANVLQAWLFFMLAFTANFFLIHHVLCLPPCEISTVACSVSSHSVCLRLIHWFYYHWHSIVILMRNELCNNCIDSSICSIPYNQT